MIVRLHYRGGEEEDHKLIIGVQFCDFNAYENDTPFEVPGSRFAIRLLEAANHPNQIRHLAIQLKNAAKVIEEIEFVKDMRGDISSPVVMAVTVEKPDSPAE
jgi:hypothetical protein